MAYIDWEYYNTNFPGLEKEQFEAILPAAEMTVDIKTHFRSRDAAGYKLCNSKILISIALIKHQIIPRNGIISRIYLHLKTSYYT